MQWEFKVNLLFLLGTIPSFFQELFASFWQRAPVIWKLRNKSSTEQGPDDVNASAVFCRLLWAVVCVLADQRFQLQSSHILVRVSWLYATDCRHHSIASCYNHEASPIPMPPWLCTGFPQPAILIRGWSILSDQCVFPISVPPASNNIYET